MKINWKLLILCIVLPLAVGGAAALLTGGGIDVFEGVEQPPFAPPAWLFPAVWTILYTLMGISSYLILVSREGREEAANALVVYVYQLFVNFLWPILFFNFRWFFVSFLWLLLLIFLVMIMIRRFYTISPGAAYMNIPYLLWLIFAGYLNFTIWWLN